MNFFRRALGLLRQFFRSFLVLKVVYFGVVGCSLGYGAWDRDAHNAVLNNTKEQGPKALPAVWNAYNEGHVARAIALTFTINLVLGSIVFIGLPSLVVPFIGLPLGAARAVTWGLVFAPAALNWTGPAVAYALLVGLLVLLEGEAYVLAMHAAYVQGKTFLFPATAPAATHWQGYKLGAVRAVQLYPLVAATLAVAAVYEAVLAIYLLPLLR